jgi:hypothetical protein
MCLVCKRKGRRGQEALPISGHRQFHVAGMHTSRCISPAYAAENGQRCFGIVTALLATESRTEAGLDVTTFR